MPKIVSGGQTGVDQGALDAALERGANCGGWCPEGRLAEDGVVPARYPVRELPGAGYVERTLENVVDSDGTLILYSKRFDGGTALTAEFCTEHARPVILLDLAGMTPADAERQVVEFIRSHGIAVLNVAGPRESKWPQGRERTRSLIAGVLDACNDGPGLGTARRTT